MPRTEIWKHLGKPMQSGTFIVLGREYRLDAWYSESSAKPGREFVTSRRGRVVQIERDVTDEERRSYLFPSLRERHPHFQVSLYTEYEDNGSTIKTDDVRQGAAWAVYIHHYKHNEFDTHLLSEIGPSRVIVHWPGAELLPSVGEIPDKTDPSLGDIRAWFAAKPTQKPKGV